jgi:hypothetical protein
MKSELAEKLMSICSPDKDLSNDHNLDNTFGIDNLTEEQRLQVEAELIKHFQFSRIVWMDLPSGLTEDGNPIVAKTIIISDTENPKYADLIGYVYKVLFTPKMYEPIELYSPVKEGCVFAPTVYNPETFEPKKSITLTWSPEFPQDINAPVRTYEDDKQMIRDMLEKVLDNPEEYKPKGHRRCMIRYAI